MFRDFDENKEGAVNKDVVKQVIGESGLPPLELDQIYRLSVVGITGKVGIGEFKVAMHLIHRRLNGYPIPYKGLAQLARLHGQMGNQIAQIEARPESFLAACRIGGLCDAGLCSLLG